jgi:hypothetical protein
MQPQFYSLSFVPPFCPHVGASHVRVSCLTLQTISKRCIYITTFTTTIWGAFTFVYTLLTRGAQNNVFVRLLCAVQCETNPPSAVAACSRTRLARHGQPPGGCCSVTSTALRPRPRYLPTMATADSLILREGRPPMEPHASTFERLPNVHGRREPLNLF